LVTKKTCELIGFTVKGVLTSAEVEQLVQESLSRVVEDVTIFSHLNPSQKNKVMITLKHKGHVVGFMGSGINYPPSYSRRMSASLWKTPWISRKNRPISSS
jgi:P-type Mg2+ transporter